MLTVRQLFNEMLAICGVDNADYAPQSLRDRALAGIREELQAMQLAGEDFYTREHGSLAVSAGTSSYALEKGVQQVLEPVRFQGAPLHALATREQYDDFGPTFLGLASRAVPPGDPLAFFVESLADHATDNVKISLLLIPEPDAAGDLVFDFMAEPPLYGAADLCEDVYPPVPHAYHESILLPLCRKNVTTSSYFKRNAAQLPEINAAYERALVLLGLADPRKPKPPQSRNDLLSVATNQRQAAQPEARG